MLLILLSCVCCAKARAKCDRSGRKRQRTCNRCTGLKEKCKWLEVGGTGVEKGKGKESEKLVIVSPCGGEKRKRTKKAAAKDNDNDNDNDNEIKEVAGPSKGKGKERARSGSGSGDNNWIVQSLDQLVVFKGLVRSSFFPFLGKTETKLVLEIPIFLVQPDQTITDQSLSVLCRSRPVSDQFSQGLLISDFLRYVLLILTICVVLNY